MSPRALAAFVFLLAASPAFSARVELVPDVVVPSGPSASAAAAVTVAPSLFASPLAAPAALAAAPAAAAPALAAVPAAAALSPARAAATPASKRGEDHPTLLQTLSAPLPDASRLSGAESAAQAEDDFASRAQLGGRAASAPLAAASDAAPASRPAGFLRPAARPAQARADDARRMESTLIPAWIRNELPVAAAKLGRALPPEYAADVLARSNVWVYKWHSRWTYEISGGLPDGHFDPKFGIRVMLKTDWRKLKDPETHFRVLFAHEYTHWLQEEGLVTRRYGGEIPAVAVEQLRAMELVGWAGMKEGRVGFIAEGNLNSFEQGREWARGDMKDESQLYFRGTLGGAAYEVGRIAGRPEAAWEFLNLVIAEKGGLKPREAFERVTGLRK